VCITNDAEELSEMYSFQTLQLQDRTALLWSVFLLALKGEFNPKVVLNMQLSAFPVPRSRIHLADAARYMLSITAP